MQTPKEEILQAIDYIEMDLINGVQMNRDEWTAVVDKVRAWLEAVEQQRAADLPKAERVRKPCRICGVVGCRKGH